MTPGDTNDRAVETVGLTKRYSAEVLAVDGLDLQVGHGEVWGLLGPNGAGKTTALRMLVGLVQPTAGEARLLGRRVTPGDDVLRRTGILVDQPRFVPHLSGRANLRLFWEAGGDAWPAPGLDRALGIAGLGKAVDRKVKGYSQGMRQRLGLAQALLGEPAVLILDEPTSGLDPQEMREVRRLVADLAGGGTTVVLSSHLLSEVEQVCSHAVVMDRGRRVAAGTVAELVGATSEVYLEVDDRDGATGVLRGLTGVTDVRPEAPGLVVRLDGASRPAVVAALVQAGVGVETVVSRRHLEEAFLDLLGEER